MKLTYRPEIDGLRAIAVGAVILYHAQITILGHQPFKGGFIGVDIFFVISGYLITSIILKELNTTGTFSFKHFYERRIRRILPALLFVMLVSLPFAWMYLLPSSFIDFSKSILYSLGFSSNIYFWYSGQSYGAESGLLKPFLHTWSLSVEEQFYILFPIVLLFTFKYFRKYLIHIFILGFVISLGLAEWTSRNHPSASFYFLPTRIWELLAGSILAYFEITIGHRSKNKILNLILPTLGLLLIGHSILFFNDEMFHPSFYTLSPIIGVCLIIWFSNKNELITKALSTKLFVGIGLISYSLYLWHYPIFSFLRITEATITKQDKIICLVLSVVLSIVSFFFIEKPSRTKKINFSFIKRSILITIATLIIFNLSTIYNLGYKKRLPTILQNSYSYNFLKFTKSKDIICDENKIQCKSKKYSEKKIYLIGDSIMERLIMDLNHRVQKKGYQFIKSTIGGCLYFPGFDRVITKTKRPTTCNNKYFNNLKQTLSEEKNSIIIFGGRFSSYLNSSNLNKPEKYIAVGNYKNISDSFKKEVLDLAKNNKIILIYPIPEVGYDPNKILYLKWINSKNKPEDFFKSTNLNTSFEIYENDNKLSFKLLDSIRGENIYRVYPHTLFCNNIVKNSCIIHDKNNIFYEDDNHPSLAGAKIINDLVNKEISKIESKK